MTETPKKDDEQIDLNAEIENLEDLLSSNDESLNDSFPLDDFEELSATPRATTKKSGMGKYIGYLAFLAILGGGGYGAYKYLPNLMQNTMLLEMEQSLTSRSAANRQPQAIIPATSDINIGNSIPVIEQMSDNEPLPVALDDVNQIVFEEETVEIEAPATQTNNGFDDVVVPDVEQHEEIASTIAEALAITQDATIDPISTEDVNVQDIVEDEEAFEETILKETVITGVETAIEAEISQINTSFERIPALPMTKNKMESDLVPLEELIIDTANDVMAMPATDIAAVVEEKEPVIIDELVEEPIVEEVVIEEAVIVEPIIEKLQIPSTPIEVVKPIEVIEKKAIAVKKITPKKKVVKRIVKLADPRVKQAQASYKSNDYAQALNLYTAILADDPANTSALTGKQLSKAKLRMSGQSMTQPVVQSTISTVKQAQPVLDNSIQGLQNQMSLNPRDASLALKLASSYKVAGNKMKAVEMYRKALQLDVIYKSGIDRMAVYDALADMQ